MWRRLSTAIQRGVVPVCGLEAFATGQAWRNTQCSGHAAQGRDEEEEWGKTKTVACHQQLAGAGSGREDGGRKTDRNVGSA